MFCNGLRFYSQLLPSNYWPWRALEPRGVTVREVPLWPGHRAGRDALASAPPPPGVDPEATPACVNSCIAQALVFGDRDDAQSNVSQLLATHKHFRMHEELGTGPGFHYVWDTLDDDADTEAAA